MGHDIIGLDLSQASNLVIIPILWCRSSERLKILYFSLSLELISEVFFPFSTENLILFSHWNSWVVFIPFKKWKYYIFPSHWNSWVRPLSLSILKILYFSLTGTHDRGLYFLQYYTFLSLMSEVYILFNIENSTIFSLSWVRSLSLSVLEIL